MNDSRIPGLYRLSVTERIAVLEQRGFLSRTDALNLSAGRPVLSVQAADKMIENVIGTFALPLAIAPNFIVNGRECIAPLVVEEPSIVAALSAAASLARASGGFKVVAAESLLIGQIHVAGIDDADAARERIVQASEQLLELANRSVPALVARGGGVRSIEVRQLELASAQTVLVVHVLVDTCDAMGANLVNSLCELLAPAIGRLCGGTIALRILSNLADRSLVSATAIFCLQDLGSNETEAHRIRDGIVLANEIANADPYRAATHNKGIMNGIDALAIATGNDWRAIEAGAHAFAGLGGRYSSLCKWSVTASGDLAGELTAPLKPGIVGGTLASNPLAALCLKMTGAGSARELAELMAAVGLAQNFAALRALAGTGIQAGHMRLHARGIAQAAGAPAHRIESIAAELALSGEVKEWKARELMRAELQPAGGETAAGKIILLGEHAVVYGRHALAVPIPNAVRASVVRDGRCSIAIPAWNVQETLGDEQGSGLATAVKLIAKALDIREKDFSIHIDTHLPRAMGLGSSAAMAVAIARALANAYDLCCGDARINEIAFECEKLAHGTPSGVDNTLACYAQPILYRRDKTTEIKTLELPEAPPLVVAYGLGAGQTRQQVAAVRSRKDRSSSAYERLFSEMDSLCLAGTEALMAGDYRQLGSCMNICHGLLNAIEVSTPELEQMVAVARQAGAVGAKLTGAGGGGSIVALCPGKVGIVAAALRDAGYRTIDVTGEQALG
ncbi:MAG TPA: hydroxymethylglutaryl-CoA reductase, degradative [Woeseiaceae bacterium]|nr:hydroxymethylglutaryl-CoA reductase, degradative [Woeseiaceae bacterium]